MQAGKKVCKSSTAFDSTIHFGNWRVFDLVNSFCLAWILIIGQLIEIGLLHSSQPVIASKRLYIDVLLLVYC